MTAENEVMLIVIGVILLCGFGAYLFDTWRDKQ